MSAADGDAAIQHRNDASQSDDLEPEHAIYAADPFRRVARGGRPAPQAPQPWPPAARATSRAGSCRCEGSSELTSPTTATADETRHTGDHNDAEEIVSAEWRRMRASPRTEPPAPSAPDDRLHLKGRVAVIVPLRTPCVCPQLRPLIDPV
jgi:hypothetical protein